MQNQQLLNILNPIFGSKGFEPPPPLMPRSNIDDNVAYAG
jgi:hypothetical protein